MAGLGLSPLTRGNPGHHRRSGAGRGPIPAHAGEPLRGVTRKRMHWAYPRSRGGTSLRASADCSGPGLSPLTRGNQSALIEIVRHNGPIPAHAGEPCNELVFRVPVWAYPRSRGGTAIASSLTQPGPGLSPLTRGNPQWRLADPGARGPIPAHAGEPQGR